MVEIDFLILLIICFLNFVLAIKVVVTTANNFFQRLVSKISMSVVTHFAICRLRLFSVFGFFKRVRHHFRTIVV
jgi:hypothetical protein